VVTCLCTHLTNFAILMVRLLQQYLRLYIPC
jgi:hypothetical protein